MALQDLSAFSLAKNSSIRMGIEEKTKVVFGTRKHAVKKKSHHPNKSNYINAQWGKRKIKKHFFLHHDPFDPFIFILFNSVVVFVYSRIFYLSEPNRRISREKKGCNFKYI